MRLNYYVLLAVAISTFLFCIGLVGVVDDAPMFKLIALVVGCFSLGFVFGAFTED
jgi:hypothetical protein